MAGLITQTLHLRVSHGAFNLAPELRVGRYHALLSCSMLSRRGMTSRRTYIKAYLRSLLRKVVHAVAPAGSNKEPAFLAYGGSPEHGWPTLTNGDKLVAGDNCYTLSKRLGMGRNSDIWAAVEIPTNRDVAVKVLTAFYTEALRNGVVWELGALTQTSASPPSPHCLQLQSSFNLKQEHDHRCLVIPIIHGDVYTLGYSLSPDDGHLPLSLAKRVVLHVLRGLAHAHERGVAHTDLKPNNIFFSSAEGTAGSEALQYTFILADFGSAQPVDKALQPVISPDLLRPPEVILGGPWDEKVDIWTLGCLIIEFLTGQTLFWRENLWPEVEMDLSTHLLFLMLSLTGESFSPERLAMSPFAHKYFDPDGTFKPNIGAKSVFCYEDAIGDYTGMERIDAVAAANFMRRCLRLNPEDRPSAKQLLSDPWFDGVDK